jgi:hypothetical protein
VSPSLVFFSQNVRQSLAAPVLLQYDYIAPENRRLVSGNDMLMYKRFDSPIDSLNFFSNYTNLLQMLNENREAAMYSSHRQARDQQDRDEQESKIQKLANMTLINVTIVNTSKISPSQEGTPDSIIDIGGVDNLFNVINTRFVNNTWDNANDVSAPVLVVKTVTGQGCLLPMHHALSLADLLPLDIVLYLLC